jgi:hypothetical protein
LQRLTTVFVSVVEANEEMKGKTLNAFQQIVEFGLDLGVVAEEDKTS